MKLAVITAVLLMSCVSASNSEKEVYICVSKSAEVYHLKKDCHGLNRCTHEVKVVSLQSAKETYKRRLCGFED